MLFETLILLVNSTNTFELNNYFNINNVFIEKQLNWFQNNISQKIDDLKYQIYLNEQEKLIQEYNITFKDNTNLSNEVFNKKVQIVKNVLTTFLLSLKDTSSFNWLEISFTTFSNNKVRWKFWIYWNKSKFQLNKNLDNIMIATTLTHELWHQLTYLLNQNEQSNFWKNCFVNKYAWRSQREDIAETFTYFMNWSVNQELNNCIQNKFDSYKNIFKEEFIIYFENCKNENSCFQSFEWYDEFVKNNYLYWIEWFTIQTVNKLYNIKEYN